MNPSSDSKAYEEYARSLFGLLNQAAPPTWYRTPPVYTPPGSSGFQFGSSSGFVFPPPGPQVSTPVSSFTQIPVREAPQARGTREPLRIERPGLPSPVTPPPSNGREMVRVSREVVPVRNQDTPRPGSSTRLLPAPAKSEERKKVCSLALTPASEGESTRGQKRKLREEGPEEEVPAKRPVSGREAVKASTDYPPLAECWTGKKFKP